MTIVSQIKNMIKEQITKALTTAKDNGQISFDQIPDFALEAPKDKNHGDFAANVAMLLAKEAHQAPRQIAQLISDNMPDASVWLSKLEIAGPGFLNFYLQPSWVYPVLPLALGQDEEYGCSDFGKNMKIQVEFVSANPTGVLHMGNARGAALGDTLCNLLRAAGYDVTKEYYINDAGNQIENFAKSLEARYLQLHGQDVPFPEDGYHGEDLIDTVKNIIAQVGDKYLQMDSETRRELLVKPALEEKISAIKKALSDFGVEYDVWFSELSLHNSGAVRQTIEDLRAKGYIYEKDNAQWFKTTLFGDEKDEVLVKADGLSTYFAADIAYHRNKFERGFERVINIWGADHHGHVARMKGAMQPFGYDPDSLQVILMQLVRLFRGGEIVRMSKRSGQYITLSELIEEVGKDAARYFFVMRSPDSHLDFDLDLAKAESSENPVYYVQYAHARICSIIKAGADQLPKVEDIDFSLLREESEFDLLRKIADLPDEIIGAASQEEPHRLTRYAHEVASLFHSFYNDCRVLTDDEELRKARLILVEATRITLRNVLQLLGVSAPERM